MSNKDNGGPVFPTTESNYHNENMRGDGMSLRDYFAAKALSGLLAWPGDEGSGSYHSNSDPKHTASMAYKYADALLAERAK